MTPLLSSSRVAALIAVVACSAPSPAQPPKLGTIDFPTSGSPAAQPHFIRGVLFLHSFEYDSARTEFKKAQSADPSFAMAYWGEAMTYTHPVWNEQDMTAARTALARLAPTAAERRAKARTPREQKYLDAVETLYGEGPKAKRDTLYSRAMERLTKEHAADLEAQAFYALSLLGLNQAVRDVPTYLRAAAVAEPIFGKNADHPGAAHYIIHAYDDPVNASKGLAAARAYSRIAPGAAHAQHMTTHIFLAMGMWDDVVSQNEIASGHDHDSWTPNHYTLWLNYAYLQQGRYAEAERMLNAMRSHVSSGGGFPGRQLWGITTMRARYLVETEQWQSPIEGWDVDISSLGADGRGIWAFVTGLGAVKRGDRAAAAKALAELAEANAGGQADGDQTNGILELELKALVRLAEGKTDEAVALMRDATAREDAMPLEYGPPVVLKPSHELLGETLLQLGRAKEAHVEFKRSLALAPKRARSLLGLARASLAMGDTKGAAENYALLREVWHRADPGLRDLSEVKGMVSPTGN